MIFNHVGPLKAYRCPRRDSRGEGGETLKWLCVISKLGSF